VSCKADKSALKITLHLPTITIIRRKAFFRCYAFGGMMNDKKSTKNESLDQDQEHVAEVEVEVEVEAEAEAEVEAALIADKGQALRVVEYWSAAPLLFV